MSEKHKVYMKAYWQRNKAKKSEYSKTYYLRHKEEVKARIKKHQNRLGKEEVKLRRKRYHLKSKFKITTELFNELLSKQANKCAICGNDRNTRGYSLHVDHCHDTGKIRGLLCFKCNSGLGYFKDNVHNLEKAIIYILNSKT